MLDIFETRNKFYSNIHRLTDYLSKALRENVVIHQINEPAHKIYLMTESHIIEGQVDVKEDQIGLKRMCVVPTDEFFSEDRISNKISESVSNLVSNIRSNKFTKSETTLDSVVSLFEEKVNLEKSRDLLESRKTSLFKNNKTEETESWKKLQDVKRQLIEFLKENKETLLENEDFLKSAIMSKVVSTAVSIPTISLGQLKKRKTFYIPSTYKDTVYEMICQREIVGKELYEARRNVSTLWTSSKEIKNLALGFEADEKQLGSLLEHAVNEVPFIALSTKKELSELLRKVHKTYSSVVNLSDKKFKEFVGRITEMKKPYKQGILHVLSEKYNINVSNLRDKPSFESLSKVNSTIFELLGKIVKNTHPVVSTVLEDVSASLRKNPGFAASLYSDFLDEAFTKAEMLEEKNLQEAALGNLNLDKIKMELMKIRDAIAQSSGGMEQPGMEEPGMEQPGMEPDIAEPGMEPGGMEQPGMEDPNMGQRPPQGQPGMKDPGMGQSPQGMPPEEQYEGEVDDGMAGGPEDPGYGGGEAPEGEMPVDDEAGMDAAYSGQDSSMEIFDLVKEIEELLSMEGEEEGMEEGPEQRRPREFNDSEEL